MNKSHLLRTTTNEAISTLVENLAATLVERGPATLGDFALAGFLKDTATLETKIWGFTRDHSKMIIEVIINGISINKVILARTLAGSYRITTNPRFISDYKRLTGVAA